MSPCPLLPIDGVIGRRSCGKLKIWGAALQADGENGVTVVTAPKHQKEKRSMDYFAGLDVSVKETRICIVDEGVTALPYREHFTG